MFFWLIQFARTALNFTRKTNETSNNCDYVRTQRNTVSFFGFRLLSIFQYTDCESERRRLLLIRFLCTRRHTWCCPILSPFFLLCHSCILHELNQPDYLVLLFEECVCVLVSVCSSNSLFVDMFCFLLFHFVYSLATWFSSPLWFDQFTAFWCCCCCCCTGVCATV